MTEQHIVTFTELVLKPCQHTYGTAPCEAALGVTGERKCYNSPRTCQDPANFTAGAEQVVRWAEPTEALDANSYDFIPSQVSVETSPQVISPGESLGIRESVSATYRNHLHNDVGFDKYLADRGYNTYEKGTFWGKFRARWPNLQGCEFRVVRGFVGQAIADMERRHYIVESTSGPDNKGSFSIKAKDVLKLLDDDKAQAPNVSNGTLAGAVSDTDTALTLSPVGIGDLEYPASGWASIGDEAVTFTRSGDSITLTGRGLEGTTAENHDADDTFQLALVFEAAEPSNILNTLWSGYTTMPAAYFDLPAWSAETTSYVGRLYNAKIMKPTGVKKLSNELIQQVGLTVWSDLVSRKVRIKAMRALLPLLRLDDSHFIPGTISATPQSEKRVSLVFTYYGRKNPLEKLDEDQNYRGILVQLDDRQQVALEDSTPAIRKIYSRWIQDRGGSQYINSLVIARYGDAPRKVGFQLPLSIVPQMGTAVELQSRIFESDDGGPEDPFVAQIIAIEKGKATYSVMTEELDFVSDVVNQSRIDIDYDQANINLRDLYNQNNPTPESGTEVPVVVHAGVSVFSENDQPAMTVGDWPEGVIITITILGRIQGKGGKGSDGDISEFASRNGQPGSGALYTRYPITIDNASGEVWGGGGGGGAVWRKMANGDIYTGCGGAGAGNTPGAASGGYSLGGQYSGQPSTTEAPSNGINGGGNGGQPGMDGEDGQNPGGGNGGQAGAAVDGESFVTYTAEGDIRGLRLN